MRERIVFLLLGAVLTLVGFGLGRWTPENVAEAQTAVVPQDVRFFRSGDAIITASDDGRTLHFWSTSERDTQLSIRPRYITSVAGPRPPAPPTPAAPAQRPGATQDEGQPAQPDQP